MMKADGLDEAIIGATHDIATGHFRLVYDVDMCIDILAKDMTRAEAMEFLEFNTFGAYVGPDTPLFMFNNWESLLEEDNE